MIRLGAHPQLLRELHRLDLNELLVAERQITRLPGCEALIVWNAIVDERLFRLAVIRQRCECWS